MVRAHGDLGGHIHREVANVHASAGPDLTAVKLIARAEAVLDDQLPAGFRIEKRVAQAQVLEQVEITETDQGGQVEEIRITQMDQSVAFRSPELRGITE